MENSNNKLLSASLSTAFCGLAAGYDFEELLSLLLDVHAHNRINKVHGTVKSNAKNVPGREDTFILTGRALASMAVAGDLAET